MSNKLQSHSIYRSRRRVEPTPLQIDFTNSSKFEPSSLAYSQTNKNHHLINLQKLPEQEEFHPYIKAFDSEQQIKKKHTCNRKNCIDNKFSGIRQLNKSSPNVRVISPIRVDIKMEQNSESQQKKKHICIHSVSRFNRKNSVEKDLLKEFKYIEDMRKEIRNRKSNNHNKYNFFISVKNSQVSKSSNLSYSLPQNPQKTNLYQQVKTRMSQRYKHMFKNFADGSRQQHKNGHFPLKDLCSVRSLRLNKSVNI